MESGRVQSFVRIVLVCLLVWLASPRPIQAQESGRWDVFRATEDGQGPVGDSITSLALDGTTLWVGTSQGLSRYDGGVWDHDPATHDIRALLLDGQANLWVGTGQGVFILGPERKWDDRQPLRSANGDVETWDVETLFPAADGGVWIGTLRGAIYWPPNTTDGSGEWLDLQGEEVVQAVWEGKDGDTWFGARSGRVFHRRPDGTLQTYTQVRDQELGTVRALWGDEQGNLWVGTEGGACILSTAEPSKGCPLVDPLGDVIVNSVSAGPQGSVWVGTTFGLWSFRGQEPAETIQPSSETALRSDDVRAITQDAEGQLWLGTTGGLARRRAGIWGQLLPASADLRENNVRAIAEDGDGNLWVATARGLRWRNEFGQWQSNAQLTGEALSCLWPEDDGSVWLCISRGLARAWPSGDVEFLSDDEGPADLQVFAIQGGPRGALWLATERGVWRREGVTWIQYTQDTPAGGPVNNAVDCIASDGGSGLWFGTLGGLSRFDGTQWVDPADMGCELREPVEALAWEPPGRLWIGTMDSGLMLCEDDQLRGPWKRDAGLVADDIRVLALQEADAGASPAAEGTTLWIGTYDGLTRARLGQEIGEQLPLVRFVGESLPHDRVQAIHVSPRYGVLIGTPNGLWAYQPSPAAPQVRLQHLEAARVVHDTVLKPDQTLELAHNEEAAVRAIGGDLRTPTDGLIYRYTVEVGEETLEGWSLDGTVPVGDVLDPGDEAVITAWAYDRDYNRSVEAARLQVIQRPVPIWDQMWFRVTLAVGLPLLPTLYVLNILYRRRGEARVHQDILLTLRQEKPSAASHVAEVTVRYQGVAGWRWRLTALRQGNMAGVFEAVERLPATPLSRTPQLERQLQLLEGRLDAREERAREALLAEPAEGTDLLPLGEALLQAGFPPELVRRLAEAEHAGKRTRIRLCFDLERSTDLARLPWEYSHHPELGFLGQHLRTALVRYLEAPPLPQRRLRYPLRILVVIAHAQDLWVPAVNTEAERLLLEEALGELASRKRVELQYLVGPAAAQLDPDLPPGSVAEEDMKEALRARLGEKPGFDVVHFVGHAGPHPRGEEEGVAEGENVLFAENAQGEYVPLGSSHLVGLLEGLRDQGLLPRLFFLNACQTGDLAGAQTLVGLIPALIVEGQLPAVIGMQYPVEDSAARMFASEFYGGLLQHGQVDWALAVARHALAQYRGEGQPDWGMPVLYLQARDGFIFKTY